MRTPLGAVQLHSFTRRLSEVLAQDLRAKPLPHPCSPITPPPEQAQPLNLSQRAPGKRPAALSLEQTPAKRPAPGDPLAGADGEELGPDGRPLPSGPPEPGPQEEPADLSSPSRIRAFLMGLPPFSVNLDDDLEDAGSATSLPVPPPGEEEEEEPMEGVDSDGGPQRPTEEDEGPDEESEVADVPPPLLVGDDEAGEGREGENSVSLSPDRDGSTVGQEVAEDQEEVRCEDFPAQGLARTLLPAVVTQKS